MEQIISTSFGTADSKYRRWIKPLWTLAILLVFPGSVVQLLVNPDPENFLLPGMLIFAVIGEFSIFWICSQIIRFFSKKSIIYGFRALLVTILVLLLCDTWYFILQGYSAIDQERNFKNYRFETAGYLISPDNKSILRPEDATAQYSNSEMARLQTQYPKADVYVRMAHYTQNGFEDSKGTYPAIFISQEIEKIVTQYLDKYELADIVYKQCGGQASYCWYFHNQYIYIDGINPISEFRGEGSIGEDLTGQFISYTPPVKGYYSSAKFKTTTDKIYELWGEIKNGQFTNWNDGHNPLWSLVPKYIDSGETIKIQITGPSHISNQHIKWIYK